LSIALCTRQTDCGRAGCPIRRSSIAAAKAAPGKERSPDGLRRTRMCGCVAHSTCPKGRQKTMANPQLNWNRADQGVAFRVTREDGGRSTPPSDWQDLGEIELPSRQPARIGPLLRLMEEERAVVSESEDNA